MAEEEIKRIQDLANLSSSFTPKNSKLDLSVSGSFTPGTVNKPTVKQEPSKPLKFGLSPLKKDNKPKKNDIF